MLYHKYIQQPWIKTLTVSQLDTICSFENMSAAYYLLQNCSFNSEYWKEKHEDRYLSDRKSVLPKFREKVWVGKSQGNGLVALFET